MSRSTAARVVVQTPFEATAARVRRSLPLGDLDIAPENLRAGEPPDHDIPQLADTLFAAGQLQPITVRAGRRKEKAWMALDGRRRLLALRLLVEQGRIEAGFEVDAFVETDPARQAAAVVLTNTATPVHIADIIAAIGRMLKSRLAVPVIARALGHAELDIKRLAALSALPDAALDALRAGRLTLRQLKLLARLPDPADRLDLARAALDGQGFADWRVTEMLNGARVHATDARCSLVSLDAYAAAGGRIETDLFGERPPVLLDPARLTELWTGRVRTIAAVFEAEGLDVRVTAGPEPDLPEDLETPGYVHGGRLPAEAMALYREARAAQAAAAETVADRLAEGGGAEAEEAALIALVRAQIALDQIALGGRVVTHLVLRPAVRTGLEVETWTPLEPEVAPDPETGAPAIDPESEVAPVFAAPRAPAPAPEIEGVGHSLHALRTEVATRGLIRALADDPRTALTALIARLFSMVARRGGSAGSESALAITAEVFNPNCGRVIPALDGAVRLRLDDRRAAWEESGLTLIRWVHGLDDADRLALLAELVALSVDVQETRTSQIRQAARAEAAELARLSGADLARHWTPDAVFLTPHPKRLLLGMLAAMDDQQEGDAALGKTDLVARVETAAQARRWAPSCLSWSGDETEAPPRDGPEGSDDSDEAPDGASGDALDEASGDAADGAGRPVGPDADPEGEGEGDAPGAGERRRAAGDDGAGVFAVTAAGVAALVAASA